MRKTHRTVKKWSYDDDNDESGASHTVNIK
jgi:hypothetical protein